MSTRKIREKFRDLSSAVSKRLKNVPRPGGHAVLIFAILTLLYIVAFMLRVTPAQYGIYLNEYDPYVHYYQAQWIYERGLKGFYDWFNWSNDTSFWYPIGRNFGSTAQPGVPFTGAFIYMIITSLGFHPSMLSVVTLIPVVFSSFTVVALYLLGKEIHSDGAGIIAGLIYAVAPSVIQRSTYGFFDNDPIASPFIILSFYFFIRAYKRGSLINAIVAGILIGYVTFIWGAYVYVVNLPGLFVIVAMILGKYTRRLGYSYLVTMGLGLLAVEQVPRTSVFLKSGVSIITWVAIAMVVIYELIYRTEIMTRRTILKVAAIGVIAFAAVFALQSFGVISPIAGKFIVALNPFYREVASPVTAWFESVGEHVTATWYIFFLDLNVLVFFVPLGFYIMLRRGSLDDIFMFVFGISAMHVASSMVRLTMFSVPAMAIIGGVGFSATVSSYFNMISKPVIRKRSKLPEIDRSIIGIIIISLMVILILSTAVTPYTFASANQPQAIVAAEGGSFNTDWPAALAWMKANLPENSVIASWWDYGYWITVNTGFPTLADNANMNFTQVQQIAIAFMSNETTALQIFKKYHVNYVVVFERFFDLGTLNPQYQGIFIPLSGDFEKSYWMARIAGYNDSEINQYFINYVSLGGGRSIPLPTGSKADQVTLYRLLFNRIPGVREMYYNVNIPQPTNFKLVYASSPNGYVLVYKVIYSNNN
ncbi:MAG: STT3 domain-containing protein [Thermoprotei archaeon]|jgi:dolichyl-diphosphooligosaccharide--protein glycosyltransferase